MQDKSSLLKNDMELYYLTPSVMENSNRLYIYIFKLRLCLYIHKGYILFVFQMMLNTLYLILQCTNKM